MKYHKNSAVLAGVIVTVVFLIISNAQSPAAPSSPQALTVKVVNSSSEAVPVTGVINVGNVLQVKPVLPAGAFSVVTLRGVLSGPDPEGTNYAITSITMTNTTADSTGGVISGQWGNTSDCSSFLGESPKILGGPSVTLRPGETVHLAFPQTLHSSGSTGRGFMPKGRFYKRIDGFYGGRISVLIRLNDSNSVQRQRMESNASLKRIRRLLI